MFTALAVLKGAVDVGVLVLFLLHFFSSIFTFSSSP